MAKFLHSIRFIFFCIFSCFSMAPAFSQQTIQIGTGTDVSPNTLYFPVYRFSASSTTTGSRSNILFTQDELSNAGIITGSTITSIQFNKISSDNFLVPANYRLLMANTTNTSLSTSLTWASILSTHTEVYTNNSFNVPNSPGWVTWDITPFEYTGGSLEIACDLAMTTGVSGATGPFQWEYTSSVPADKIVGVASATGTTLNGGVAAYKHRPNAKFTFVLPGPCSTPPTPGLAQSSETNVCSGQSFNLSLSGNSFGIGQTYQWQSSPDDLIWTDIPGANENILNTTQTATTYYRNAVTCSGNTAFSSSVLVNGPNLVSGNFTINSLFPSGGTNFQSINEAIDYLKCGIIGPVVFNIEPFTGPYNERVVIQEVPGASSTNTITINGNGSILMWNPTGSTDRTAFVLDGADHIILDSLTIDVSAGTTYGWGIQLTNQADSNIIRNCTVLTNTISTSTNYAGIVISGSATSPTSSGNNANGNLIEGNKITGGSYGIQIYGSTTTYNENNLIKDNLIEDFYNYGIYFYGQMNSTMSGNDMSRPTRTSVSTYGCYISTNGGGLLIEKNKVHNLQDSDPTPTTAYCFYLSGDGVSGNPNHFENNLVYNIVNGNSTQYGIYGTSADYWNIYHNTIILDDASSTAGTTYASYTAAANELHIYNNIFYVTRGGTGNKVALYGSTAGFTASNNNVLYVNAPSATNAAVVYKSGYFTTLADWQASNGNAFDQNSYSIDPLFQIFNPGEYIPSEPSINDIGADVSVLTDILGEPRTANPDPGAFEFSIGGCINPPTTGIVSTATSVCQNTDFTLDLTGNSFGENMTYQWQSSTDNSIWNNLGPAGSAPLYTTSQTSDTYYRCVLKCGNGTPVASPGILVLSPSLVSGTYTINSLFPTGVGNFQSFSDAINFVSCGINGPVVFNVEPFTGPYNEQVVIPQIGGASATNTITINGNGTSLMWNPTGTSDRTAFILDGADHVILDSLTIDVSAGTTYGWGIQLTNQADSNIIRNCTILGNTSSTATNYAGIVISGSLTSAASSGNNGNGNLIENNDITGGYYGVQVYGSTSEYNEHNIVRNNMIKDFYYYGVYFYGQGNSTMSGNDMSRPTRTTSSTYACYVSSNNGGLLIEKNKVHNIQDNDPSPGTAYCFYITGDGVSGNPNHFENNLAYNILNGNSAQYGIYGTSADYWNIYQNTIILDDASSTAGTTYASYTAAANELNIYNNIFYVTRGGTGNKVALYGGTAGFAASNNNVLYVNAPSATNAAVAYLSGYYTTLADWQASNGNAYDQNSYSVDPLFQIFNPGEYIPSEPSINNIGADVGVLTDILGETRTANPDPGAFEFSIGGCTNPPSPGFVTAEPTICPNTDFNLDLTGNSVGENLTFQWQISPDSTNWTNIGTPGTAPLFTTSQAFGNFYRCVLKCGAGSPVASAGFYVNSPALIPGGTFTINNTLPTGGGNFQSFGDAINFMSCGISGPLVFNVEPFTGPYNTQVVIPEIKGASATNTVTFNGNGSILMWDPTGTNDRTALVLDGADHIILDSLTIDVSAGTTYGWGIQLTNQADSNIIRNCTILANTSSTLSNYASIVISGSATSATSSGNNGNGNLIEGNDITGGYYGIQVYGSTSEYNEHNIVRNNMIKDFYYYGVYFYGQMNSTMSGNDISRPTRTTSSSYACYISSNNGGLLIEKNKVHNIQDSDPSPGTAYVFYLSGDGVSGNPNHFENNLVYNIVNGNSSQYGIYGTSADYWNIYHNTIILDDASSTSGTTYASYTAAANELNIYNNIFYVTRGGTGNKVALYGSTSGFTASNNNVFYVNAPSATNAAVVYKSGYFTTLADWQASNAGAYDQNSLSVDPLFAEASFGNLLPYEPLLDNAGNALAGVSTDIRGEVRNLAAPTPGAFEINTILPVTLIHLSGTRQSNDVRLDWTTVNEFNNAGFDIERSLDGVRFTKVGYVTTRAANGNNVGKLQYDYVDINAPKAQVFYRLKQIDKDGTSELSNIVVMTRIGVDKLDIVNVYPNPVARAMGDLKVQMDAPEQNRVVFIITDVTGKIIKQQTEFLRAGSNTFNLNIRKLSSGTYFVKAVCADGCETLVRKFIRQ